MADASLVGRDRELAQLRRVLDSVGPGSPRIVEVVGDPGIGKTRLLLEFAAAAERAGRLVLWGRAAEYERQVPFGIVIDALEDHVAGVDPQSLTRLSAAETSMLRAVFPALPALGTDAAPLNLIEAERYRLHRAARSLLEALTPPAGLVLILDDLHWADDGSVELLDHLLRHPPRGAVLLAVAHRPRQTPDRLRHALARAVQDGMAELIELVSLSPADADRLLPAEVCSTHRAELYAASEGNPFYLLALARSGAASSALSADGLPPDGTIPMPVRAALAGDLAALSRTQLLVAQAVAIAGDSVGPDLVAHAAGLGMDDVLAALDELTDRDLVRPDRAGSRFRFRHPLLRSATYESAAVGWRIAAHGRCAAALRDRGAPVADQAHHVERSAQWGDMQAIGVLREAAAATVHSSPASAAHWLEAALRLLPDDPACLVDRLRMLGMRAKALGVIGRLQNSRDALHELLRLLPVEFAEQRAQTVAFSATIARLTGRHAEARASLLAELSAVDDQNGTAALALKLGLASGIIMFFEPAHSQDWASEALATARRNPNRALLASALAICALASHIRATVDDRTAAWIDEAAALLDALPDGELSQEMEAIAWLSAAEIYHERYDDARRHVARALHLARATGQSHIVSYVHGMRGSIHAMQGNLAAATDCFENQLDAAQLTGSDSMRTLALQLRCWLAIWRGDLDEALSLGREAVMCADRAMSHYAGMAQGMLGQAHLHNGDPVTAIGLLLKGGGPELWQIDPRLRIRWYEALAAAEAALGHTEKATAWADRLDAQSFGLPWRTGLAHIARAHALLSTDPASAAGHAEAAAEALTRAGTRVDAGRAHLLAGTALAATGANDRARERFAHARELFETCGARLFLDQTVREERRMNARQPRMTSSRHHGPTAHPALTPREREVADLVGLGLTNREIAKKLHLSPKTVDVHLTRLYAKLGVSRRAAVAGRLAELEGS